MLTFLTDNMATVLISLMLMGIIFLIIRGMRRDRKAGKGCTGCSGCGSCSYVCNIDKKSTNMLNK